MTRLGSMKWGSCGSAVVGGTSYKCVSGDIFVTGLGACGSSTFFFVFCAAGLSTKKQ